MLHRCLFVWSLALLYGAATACASEAGSATPHAAPRPDLPAGVALEPAIAHIALVMPDSSSLLARAAQAVQRGFVEAAKIQGSPMLPIRVYPTAEHPQSVVLNYRRALASGARLVVGPLTRDGVTALAGSGRIAVPTVALNVPDGNYPLPPNLYVLSLHIEAEARQVARLAANESRRSATTVTADTPLLRRVREAFVDEFTRLGGTIVAEYAFAPDTAALAALRQALKAESADMAFLALDFPRARIVRPYLGALPIYATSQVYPGDTTPLAGFDLANVRFLDMPWLLQPDHPAVMVYPRAEFSDASHLERLYALGIDAFRVGWALLHGSAGAPLDGVTGLLRLGPDRTFVRELTGAQFSDGKLLTFAGKQ